MAQEIYLVDSRRLYTHPVDAEFDPDRPDWVAVPYDGRLKKPPAVGAHEIQRSLGDAPESDWEVIPDWRGHRYWLADGSEHVITQEGVSPPVDALAVKPPPTLAALKSDKAKELELACGQQILGGFSSEALGVLMRYPSKATDQANLTASVLDAVLNADNPGWITPFWCQSDPDGWAWRPHTAEQIKQVGRDGKSAVLAAQARNAELQAQVAQAQTAEAVEAIKW